MDTVAQQILVIIVFLALLVYINIKAKSSQVLKTITFGLLIAGFVVIVILLAGWIL